MFTEGVTCLAKVITSLIDIAPVQVVLIQGNHSCYEEFYAACYLKAYFKDNKNVAVDDSTNPRKYILLGKNLIGFSHGSDEKDTIYGLMQSEVPELWGKTTTHEFILGHFHKEDVSEKNGVTVRVMPSSTKADAWLYKNGYTMNKRKTMALLYDENEGLVNVSYVNSI